MRLAQRPSLSLVPAAARTSGTPLRSRRAWLVGAWVLVSLASLAPTGAAHGGQMVVPRLPASTGVSAPGGAATLASAADRTGPLDGWDLWWELQRDRFVDLDLYFAGPKRTSGSGGLLSGHGRRADSTPEPPTGTVVTRRIVPALLELAASEHEPEVLDAVALALGRCARGRDDEASLSALLELLEHPASSVAAAAALGLGLTGSPAATDALRARLDAESLDVASFAALGLGFLDEPRAVHALLQVSVDGAAPRDVRACALRGLGLLDPTRAHAQLARDTLVPLLDDGSLDPTLRAHAATSAGRLGGSECIAALRDRLGDRDEHALVRSGAALGLGAGATPGDPDVIDQLGLLARQEREGVVRHRVLAALGELGRRDRGGPETAAAHGRLVGTLTRELRRGGRNGNRAWAGLAAALAAGHRPGVHTLVRERLADAYEDEKDPATRAALGLAFGLLGVDEQGPALLSAFQLAKDDGERGYAAVALGLLRHTPAAGWLGQLLRMPDARGLVRLRCATGLALLGDRNAVPALLAMLASPVAGAPESAASALGLMGDGAAVAPLLELVGQPLLPEDPAPRGPGPVALATDASAGQLDDEALAAAAEAEVRRRAFAVVALGLLGERGLFPGQPSALAALRAHVDPRAQVPALLAAWSVL